MKYIKLFENFTDRTIKVPMNIGDDEILLEKWLKNDGDYIDINDPLCELATSKVNYEISAENSGILHIIVKDYNNSKYANVKPGQIIGEIKEDIVKNIIDKF